MKRKTILWIIAAALLGTGVGRYGATVAAWLGFGAPGKAAADAPGQSRHDAAKHGAQASTPAPQGQRRVLYWYDPMHPTYKSDKPGTAPDCGMDLVPKYADEGEPTRTMPPGSVLISPAKQQLIGVRMSQVKLERVARTIRAVARMQADETTIARIHVKVAGWVEQVDVDFVGKLVKKGQPLFSLYSPELVATQEEYLIARRGEKYFEGSSYPEVARGAQSLLQVARDRLRLWDISKEQIEHLENTGKVSRTLVFYSPIDGFVLKRNLYKGVYVTPETELYEIADLSKIWVTADIYEYELPYVQVGQSATMRLSYFPGKAYTGKVSYVYPTLDPTTRTAKVRLEFPNPDFELKPDMYAEVELQVDYGRHVVVPQEAVLDSGAEQVVFVAHADGYFEPRKIRMGARVDDRIVVLGGLRPGETIVTSGNFLIDSESRLKSAMGGMKH